MEQGWTEYGFIGMVFYLVITQTFSIVKNVIRDKNGSNPIKIGNRVESIQDMVTELHHLHKITDRDGVPIWYLRDKVVCDINKSADNTEIIKRDLMEVIRRNNELYELLNNNIKILNSLLIKKNI